MRFPIGLGKTMVSHPHTRISRTSRAFNMTADLLQRDQQGFGIVLEGTSFNRPTFSAQQNYVAGYSIIFSALSMALNSRFSNRIVMILVEGEVLQKTSAPPLPWPQDVGALLRRILGRVGVSLLRLSVQSPPVEASSHKKMKQHRHRLELR